MNQQPVRQAWSGLAIVRIFALCSVAEGIVFAEMKEVPRLSPIVTLCLRPEGEMDPNFLDSMTEDVDGLLESAGIAVDWKVDRVPDPVFAIVVVNIRGSCSAADLPAGPPGPRALGWAHISDGVVLPFCVLDCGRLLARITPEVRTQPVEKRNRLLGRAAARVLGHEIFHILTASKRHSNAGLTRSTLSVTDLIQGDTEFLADDIRRIRLGPVCNGFQKEKVFSSH